MEFQYCRSCRDPPVPKQAQKTREPTVFELSCQRANSVEWYLERKKYMREYYRHRFFK